eukprot:347452-Chlamydomonas_euryale.AAC.2
MPIITRAPAARSCVGPRTHEGVPSLPLSRTGSRGPSYFPELLPWYPATRVAGARVDICAICHIWQSGCLLHLAQWLSPAPGTHAGRCVPPAPAVCMWWNPGNAGDADASVCVRARERKAWAGPRSCSAIESTYRLAGVTMRAHVTCCFRAHVVECKHIPAGRKSLIDAKTCEDSGTI